MNKAYVSIACGSPAYFKFAFNLAVSLKYHKSQIPFVLLAYGNDGYDVIKPYQHVFDKVIWLKPQHKMPFYNKTLVHQYMKDYDQYLFIDADTIAIQNPDSLFEGEGVPFKAILEKNGTKGNHNIKVAWCVVDELYDYYGAKPTNVFSELNTSLMMVNRCKTSDDIFTLAEHFYASEWYPKGKRLGPMNRPSLGHWPDEIAFETAMLLMGYENPKWRPFHTHYHGTKAAPQFIAQIQKNHPGRMFWTMPGNAGNVNATMWKEYHRYCHYYTVNLALEQYGKKGALGNGFKPGSREKAANGLNISKEYTGIRKRERPEKIQLLIYSYK